MPHLSGHVLQSILADLKGREAVDSMDVLNHEAEILSLPPRERDRLRYALIDHMGREEWEAAWHLLGGHAEEEEAGASGEERAVATPLSEITPRDIDWLWHGWLPRGCVVTVAGEPGIGKSYLLAAVATAVTLGKPLPGDSGEREPENVLLIGDEDAPDAVLLPRFKGLGADLHRVFVETEIAAPDGARRPPVLPEDGPRIAQLAAEKRAALVVVDTLVSVEPASIDLRQQQGQRAILAPLMRMAADLNCAVIAVRHMRKSAADNPNHRIVGSVDASAAARLVWLVGPDPTNPERRGVAVSKTNLGERPAPRAFVIEKGQFLWEPGAAPDLSPEAIAGPLVAAEERSALEAAMDYLRNALADGPVPGADIQKDARGADFHERTLDTAKAKLGIVSRKEPGKGGKWLWSLPPTKDASTPLSNSDCTLAPLPETPDLTGITDKGARVQSTYIEGHLHPYPADADPPPTTPCPACGGRVYWLPQQLPDWRCEVCIPPLHPNLVRAVEEVV